MFRHAWLGTCLALLAGCGASKDAGNDDLGDDASVVEGDGFNPGTESGLELDAALAETGGTTCKNLQCKQVTCAGGGTTSVSGTVWNPAKTDPLYNVVVYVPNATPDTFKPGISCEKCGTVSGEPLATALSGADGKFRIDNVPVGDNIPLVIQIGRWRRQVIIPKVTECVDNPLSGDLTRLPKNKKEGDIPLTAIVTSTYDPTECILRKIGIDDAEFNIGTGRIHLYKGSGA